MPAKKKSVSKKAAKKSKTNTATAKKTSGKKPSTTKKAGKAAPKSAAKKRSAKNSRTGVEPVSPQAKKSIGKGTVSRSGISADKKATPIVFSLDEVAELVAAKKSESKEKATAPQSVKKVAKAPEKKSKAIVDDKPTEKRSHAAASLADILGFNPAEKKKRTELEDNQIPKKYKKYYKLLVELRKHVSDEIHLHTSDTLKHSARDESGDSASYGNHQADAGTDSFDRDFALSLVSSEQEALNEIEEAILRIKDGSYGVCAVTGKAIPAARLTAVPFARFSVEGQLEHERNQQRRHNRSVSGGIFGDVSDAPKIQSSDDEDEE
jgi:RNA polymerase-binding transcription factor DksA